MTQNKDTTPTCNSRAQDICRTVCKKLYYLKSITLQQHIIDIEETKDGMVTVCITPTSDKAANSSFIMHKANDNIIKVSTTRNLKTDATDVTTMVMV